MITILVPALCAVIGLLIYFGSNQNPKFQHVGDVMFWTGLLVTLWVLANQSASFFK